MFDRAWRLTKFVRTIDPSLKVKRASNGVLQLWRNGGRLDVSHGKQKEEFIFAFTDDWTLRGKPVDWGLEPLLLKLRESDSWNRDVLNELRKKREKQEEDEKRMTRNDIRALAADMRKDIAKATDDINTSTLEKIDNRRKRDGNCKS